MTSTSLRLPSDMADAVKLEAQRRGTTVNELIRSLISAHLRQVEEQQLYDDFTRLGEEAAACDVEYAIHAASEVVLRDG